MNGWERRDNLCSAGGSLHLFDVHLVPIWWSSRVSRGRQGSPGEFPGVFSGAPGASRGSQGVFKGLQGASRTIQVSSGSLQGSSGRLPGSSEAPICKTVDTGRGNYHPIFQFPLFMAKKCHFLVMLNQWFSAAFIIQ